MAMGVKVVTESLLYLKEYNYKNAVTVTYSMRTLDIVKTIYVYVDCIPFLLPGFFLVLGTLVS